MIFARGAVKDLGVGANCLIFFLELYFARALRLKRVTNKQPTIPIKAVSAIRVIAVKSDKDNVTMQFCNRRTTVHFFYFCACLLFYE